MKKYFFIVFYFFLQYLPFAFGAVGEADLMDPAFRSKVVGSMDNLFSEDTNQVLENLCWVTQVCSQGDAFQLFMEDCAREVFLSKFGKDAIMTDRSFLGSIFIEAGTKWRLNLRGQQAMLEGVDCKCLGAFKERFLSAQGYSGIILDICLDRVEQEGDSAEVKILRKVLFGREYKEAIKWFLKAIEKGDAMSFYRLQEIDEQGNEVARDILEKLAEIDNAQALYTLGKIKRGRGAC